MAEGGNKATVIFKTGRFDKIYLAVIIKCSAVHALLTLLMMTVESMLSKRPVLRRDD